MKYFSLFKENMSVLYQRGGIHIFVGSVISQFVAFFGSIFLVRILSKEEFGYLSYLENLYGYMYVIAGFGLSNAVLRYVIKSDSVEKELSVYNYVVKNSFLVNALLLLFFLIFFLYYPHPLKFSQSNEILWIIIISLPFQYLVLVNHSALRAILENKLYAISTLTVGILIVLSRTIASYFYGVEGALFARTFIYLVAACILTYLFYTRYFKTHAPVALKTVEKREINVFSVQYMVTNSIWVIFMLNDTFLLGRILGDPAIVAEYRVAYAFPANLAIIATSIGLFVGPYFVKNEENNKWVWENYKKLLLYELLIVLGVSAFLVIFSYYIVYYVYGEQYLSAVNLMRILTISSVINSVFRYTTAHLLSSMGKVKYNMIISVLGVVLQIILNIILIPKYGVYGPAFTSIIVYTIMSLLLIMVFMNVYRN